MFGKAKSILFNIYSFKIGKELKGIKRSSDYSCKTELLKSVYNDMKLLADNATGFDEIKTYDALKAKLLICEGQYCSDEYIMESMPLYDPCDPKFVNRKIGNYKTAEELVEHLVWFTRTGLLNMLNEADHRITSLNDLSLVNECYNTSCLVSSLCKMMNIPCKIVKIPPAFTDDIQLLDGNGFHYFAVISVGGKDFIIDCTYRQFFRVDKNLIERLGVFRLNGCDPGVYMMMGRSRRKTASHLLKHGWIEATSENLKNYFDGFALASRNGLFYEKFKWASYTTPYTVSDYEKFLNGFDHQINHEPIECLGEQYTSLEDPKFRF